MSEEVKQEGDFKMKKKKGRPRKLTSQSETVKVDLSKKEEEDAVQEPSTEKVVLQSDEQSKETGEESKVELQEVGETHDKQESTEEKVEPPIVEITEDADPTAPPDGGRRHRLQNRLSGSAAEGRIWPDGLGAGPVSST